MDIATLLGVILGFSVLIISIVTGGGADSFVHIPSMAVVVGGMLCTVLIHFSMAQFLGIFTVMKKTFLNKAPNPSDLIQQMVNFAAINRRDGTLALEQEIRKTDNQFVCKGLQMLVDGLDEDSVRDVMSLEISSLQERHSDGKKILEFMGASAPAFGMIGTLIGLVQMLQNLSDPSGIGAGMATALLTTFYGAVLANLMFIPLAGKLSLYSKKECLGMDMVQEGICAISRGENPTAVREKMQAFISPNSRADVKATV